VAGAGARRKVVVVDGVAADDAIRVLLAPPLAPPSP